MPKIRKRYVLLTYSHDIVSKDVLRSTLRDAYLGLPNRPTNFNNLFLPLLQGYVIFSVPHFLVKGFEAAVKEEFSKRGGKCEIILVSGTLRALRGKARIKPTAKGLSERASAKD